MWGRLRTRVRTRLLFRSARRLALLMGVGVALLIEGLAALAAEEVAHTIWDG